MDKGESQYLNLIDNILKNGKFRSDRTGTGTYSIFRAEMEFDLRDHKMPLLTTKRVFWRGVVEELLWFISGSTDSHKLREKGVHIWDANGSREFLDKYGFTDREEGDLGPVYGFQWRHCGAEYKDKNTDYTGKGFDQLKELIDKIKRDPYDRGHILSAWNPADIPKMALRPCHCFAKFYVDDGELTCELYQRSSDVGLGVPFNIASYALLTYMIAHVTGLKAGKFVHSLRDVHIYKDHVEPLQEQLKRVPGEFPKIIFGRKIDDIDDFKSDDIKLIGYNPQPSIPMRMSA